MSIAAQAPDWSTLETELHCPRCEYNLRLLTLPRCPECGLEFDWEELIAATARERECPIFEYQWRRRPIRSLLYTVWLAMTPWRLWRMVKLEFEPRFGSLAVLTLVVLSSMYVLQAAMWAVWWQVLTYVSGSNVNAWLVFRQYFGSEALLFALQTQFLPLFVVLAAICVYRFTMVRFRIRAAHLIRIALLAWVGWIAVGTITQLAVYLAVVPQLVTKSRAPNTLPTWIDMGGKVLALGLFSASIAVAFGRYLRLRRAWLAAAASMTLATVAMTVFTIAYTVYGRRRTFGDTLAPLDAWIPGLQWFCLRVLSWS